MQEARERRAGDEGEGAGDRGRARDLSGDAQVGAEHAHGVAEADAELLGECLVDHDSASGRHVRRARDRAAADEGDDTALVAPLDEDALVEDRRRRADALDARNRAHVRLGERRLGHVHRLHSLLRHDHIRAGAVDVAGQALSMPAKIAFKARTSRSAAAIPTRPASVRPRLAASWRRASGTCELRRMRSSLEGALPGRGLPGSAPAQGRRGGRRRAQPAPSRAHRAARARSGTWVRSRRRRERQRAQRRRQRQCRGRRARRTGRRPGARGRRA